MTRDDKLLRETILAELKRRRNQLGKDDKPVGSDPGDGRHATRPIYPPSRAVSASEELISGRRQGMSSSPAHPAAK
jgi:hypothetical protein